MPTYYELLGIAPDSSQEDIKKAYHELAFKYHPDVNRSGSAPEMMKSLNEAYRVLSDPQKRAEYDSKIRMLRAYKETKREPERPVEKRTAPADDGDPVDYGVYEEEVKKRSRADAGGDTEQMADEIQYMYAGPQERVLSLLMDFFFGLLMVLVAFVLATAIPIGTDFVNQNLLLVFFSISLAYCGIFEGSWAGATPGKMFFKIRVCDRNGRPISRKSTVIRSMVKVSTIYLLLYMLFTGFWPISLGAIAAITLLMYTKNWTLHDYLAKTMVAKIEWYLYR